MEGFALHRPRSDRSPVPLNLRQVARVFLFSAASLLPCCLAAAQSRAASSFPSHLSNDFDYSTFARFDAPAPPKTLIN